MFNLAPSRDALARSGRNLAPGIGLALTIAAAASFLAEHYGGPVMLFALLIGMTFNFLATEGRCAAGIAFTSRTVLRIGVALLGVRVTVADISALGISTVLVVVGLIALTIATDPSASAQVTSSTVNGQTFSVTPTMSQDKRLKMLSWVCKCQERGSTISTTAITRFSSPWQTS